MMSFSSGLPLALPTAWRPVAGPPWESFAMKSNQRRARWLVAAALVVGLAPAFGALAAPADAQPTAQRPTSPWHSLLSWVDGWWTPADDPGSVQAAAKGPKTGGGGDQGVGLDPDGTDPDPGDGSDEEDPGLPPGSGG